MGEERTEGAQQGTEYLTVGEAAKMLGVHRNTIHNHKGLRKESDFSDQHHKFWSEGDEPVE